MKNVEAAAKAVEAYTGQQLVDMNDAEITEHVQDLLTDLAHFQEAYGIAANDYAAHLHYLQEAGRCLGCGSTREEIQTEHDADVAGGMPMPIPPEECAGVWDRLGEPGPHVWEEIPPRTEFDGAPQDLGNETYATDGSAVIEEYQKTQALKKRL